MNGARLYASLLSTGQRGRLFWVAGEHARGRTFHIYVLPTEEAVIRPHQLPTDTVEVYGVTGGQPGWTETYGWLHHGKWEDDFAEIVTTKKAAIAFAERERRLDREREEAEARSRAESLLSTYK